MKNVKDILFNTHSRRFSNADSSRKSCLACITFRKTIFTLRGSCNDSLIGTFKTKCFKFQKNFLDNFCKFTFRQIIDSHMYAYRYSQRLSKTSEAPKDSLRHPKTLKIFRDLYKSCISRVD